MKTLTTSKPMFVRSQTYGSPVVQIPARYDVLHMPSGQDAYIYLASNGWNVCRVIGGTEYRQYRYHANPDVALADIQAQIVDEGDTYAVMPRWAIDELMQRYRLRREQTCRPQRKK